jgi:hypothetical protein
MGTLSGRLPDSLHKQLTELAKREGVSMNQLISSAVGEKVTALMTVEYLQERAERGSRRKYEAALARVPDREPDDLDKLPDGALKRSGKRRR